MQPLDTLTTQSIEILRTLVGFDSVSRNSNLALIEWVENYLKPHGVVATRVPSPDGTKSNLLVRIGEDKPGGLVLSGHTDVVPIDGQAWDSDPFTLTERDGLLYGRGSSDMKGFVAICLALVPHFKQHVAKRPIYLALSYDEEVGCLGVPYLLKHLLATAAMPEFAVLGEPTMMEVVTAHKGVLSFETVVHGLEAHSSQPHLGVNAVHIACELVTYLRSLGAELAQNGLHDERFMPPYSTVHVGVINGGTARNIIAKECRFVWEIRPLPSENTDTLLARFRDHCATLEQQMHKTDASTGITTTPMSRMSGVTLPERGEKACHHVMRCAGRNSAQVVSFGTEAGAFQDHGIPAIICGPGSIDQAHKPNEFIAISQMRAGVEFLLNLTDSSS